jgi:hypothetical protein
MSIAGDVTPPDSRTKACDLSPAAAARPTDDEDAESRYPGLAFHRTSSRARQRRWDRAVHEFWARETKRAGRDARRVNASTRREPLEAGPVADPLGEAVPAFPQLEVVSEGGFEPPPSVKRTRPST